MKKYLNVGLLFFFTLTVTGCGGSGDSNNHSSKAEDYNPLAYARSTLNQVNNRESVIPSQCYTKTEGVSNPCWTCHTSSQPKNDMDDWDLQETYAFSDVGLENHWTNLFADRTTDIAATSDDEALKYVQEDNYTALRQAMDKAENYSGWRPDLDFETGFDDEGFALDGSWWRAFRYKPFLGTFWPTNGSTDDVMIRLPKKFYTDKSGKESREIYKINLAIMETAISVAPAISDANLNRKVEPINETLAEADLNNNGILEASVESISGLPTYYTGAAEDEQVVRHLYPQGTEFLHTVRYIDPDADNLISKRIKEVRYSRKDHFLDNWALLAAYEGELEEKDAGVLPVFGGTALAGLTNDFGWRLQGFIEDAEGRLRLQSEEEHLYCMGCHSTLGVTVDQSFGFPRKVPGVSGWGYQDIAGIKDVPQAGHAEPEILTYFKRVQGGDEFRENTEILDKFFPNGLLDEQDVRRAATGGDQDIRYLITPSRERALQLNKAYMSLVRSQTFYLGRDTVLQPVTNVHKNIESGSTDLVDTGKVYQDGSMWLDWR